jgi:hypothetical protein
MEDRKIRIVGAIIATVIIIFLIVFKQGSVKNDFIKDFNINEIEIIEDTLIYNDYDGIPATGTFVYKYELNEIMVDTSKWKPLPFENDFIYSYLELADVEIINGHYIYNESDNKEDDSYYFDIAILDSNTNTLYHMKHKTD